MSRREKILALKRNAPAILPSILRCDFGDLKSEIGRLQSAHVPALHLDVMDGHFVPNFTFGMPIVAGIRKRWELPLDVHLMISNPGQYIDRFFAAGADAITFHIEAVEDPRPLLEHTRQLGAASGIVLNPDTPLSKIRSCVGLCDIVLIMSVQAGFGGQAFDPVALERLAAAREMFGNEVLLEVDGGVNSETIHDCVQAGAELLVIGSAISGQSDYGLAVDQLRESITRSSSRADGCG